MKFLYLAGAIVGLVVVVNQAKGADKDNGCLVLIDKDEEAKEPGLTYRRTYEQKLFVTPGDLARYFFSPAFSEPEMAVSVYKDPAKKGGLPGGYWLTATKTSHRIWGAATMAPPRDVRSIGVIRHDVPMPEAIAKAVNSVWITMLLQLRPRNTLEIEGDSDTIIFSARGPNGRNLRGRPYGSGAKCEAMISLGDQLIEYAAAPLAERRERARRIEQDASKLLQKLRD
jgi:hypothetical protein